MVMVVVLKVSLGSEVNDKDDDDIAGHGQLCQLYLNHWRAQEENAWSEKRRRRLRLLFVVIVTCNSP